MKSNLNDAELIAEVYAVSKSRAPEVIEEFAPIVAAAARIAGGMAVKKIASKVGDAFSGSEDEVQEAEDQEQGSCAHAEQGCTCTDCPECEANGAPEDSHEVDLEDSCGYDQVAEPEVQDVDDAVHITLSDLHKTLKCAAALTELLSNASEITGDVTVKVARAADILGDVYDKLDYDLNGFSVHNTGHEDLSHV